MDVMMMGTADCYKGFGNWIFYLRRGFGGVFGEVLGLVFIVGLRVLSFSSCLNL